MMKKVLLLSILLIVLLAPVGAGVDTGLQVHFIDVGQADSTLLIDSGETMLIDAGNNADGRLVVRYLQNLGIDHIDILVGTHPHEDHIGGLDDIIESFSIGKIVMPAKTHNTESFEDVLDAIAGKGMGITIPKVGDVFQIGGSTLTLLAPVRTDYFNINDHSLVFKLVRSGKRILFAADAETVSEWHMIGNKADLASDILKVGHHGSDTSTNSTFIGLVSPAISIIHVGKANPYAHPSSMVLKRIPGAIYRTDIEGSIIVGISDTGQITIDTHKQHPNPAWQEVRYIGESSSGLYHRLTCSVLPGAASQVGLFTAEEALTLGYSPCSVCKP
ncbi:MAG: MBL fold metallo-hydrolase [Spirochaetae bacterium HGW-Spirochaetae-8]|nr:MAG: MBL fold metallo-hydrolase [Spirochaetae bacterium HGW-Spirochaetae-8]